jgi:hypothetical protein
MGGDTPCVASRSRNNQSTKRRGSILIVGSVLAVGYVLAPDVNAGTITNFTGSYALNQFTLANINIQPLANPNGTATSPDGGLTLVLTGGLSGSGSLGETDFFVGAAASGMVQFNWMFANGVPGFISGGYLLGADSTATCAPACTTLSNSSGTGNVSFSVTPGEVFGYFVITDNQANPITGDPGILTITNFSAPSSGSPVPEPGTATMFMVAGAAAATCHERGWLRRRGNTRS